MTAERPERRLRIAADRARKADTAVRVARHLDGPEAPELPELREKYTASLGEAAAAARALIDHAGGDCPFCRSSEDT